MPRARTTKPPPKFYSIGEWFGSDIASLDAGERKRFADLATSKKVKVMPCPFKKDKQCNKAGGVCSVRQYMRESADGPISLGNLVTTCPSRFFQAYVSYSPKASLAWWLSFTTLELFVVLFL